MRVADGVGVFVLLGVIVGVGVDVVVKVIVGVGVMVGVEVGGSPSTVNAPDTCCSRPK